MLLSACANRSGDTSYSHEGAYMLNWTCEKMASDYRKDKVTNPELCAGYDVDGWPIDGAEIRLRDTEAATGISESAG